MVATTATTASGDRNPGPRAALRAARERGGVLRPELRRQRGLRAAGLERRGADVVRGRVDRAADRAGDRALRSAAEEPTDRATQHAGDRVEQVAEKAGIAPDHVVPATVAHEGFTARPRASRRA